MPQHPDAALSLSGKKEEQENTIRETKDFKNNKHMVKSDQHTLQISKDNGEHGDSSTRRQTSSGQG